MSLGISNVENEKFIGRYSHDFKHNFASVLASDHLNRFVSFQI